MTRPKSIDQFTLFDIPYVGKSTPHTAANRAGSFVDNMNLPIHGWFRYSAGFSAQWAEATIRSYGTPRVLDPFAGSGTTLLAAEASHVQALGFENHAFVERIGRAKLGWRVEPEIFRSNIQMLISLAQEKESSILLLDSDLLKKCYSVDALQKLSSIRESYEEMAAALGVYAPLVWLCITSILRETSYVGTAQWQYILPNKKKLRTKDPYTALLDRSRQMAADIVYASGKFTGAGEIHRHDARKRFDIACEPFDLVITSPPYPNNYDYADATRLEMTYWGEVTNWGDLHKYVRADLVRSCSQHASAERLELLHLLASRDIEPIRDELSKVCVELEKMRLTKAGKKHYHTMIAAYFVDLAAVWKQLRGLVAEKGKAAFVVGDSAPYGIYVPCEEWLGRLALSAGFKSYSFTKLRDRNVKWKNRKHRVPLKEGILWVDA